MAHSTMPEMRTDLTREALAELSDELLLLLSDAQSFPQDQELSLACDRTTLP